MFVSDLQAHDQLYSVARIRVELYGSLGATGKGHGTDKAVILGLEGEAPDTVNTDDIPARLEAIRARGQLALPGKHELDFEAQRDLIFHKRKVLPYHPNGMKCLALDSAGQVLRERSYYSVGGGFVVNEAAAGADRIVEDRTPRAFPFSTGAELLSICSEEGLSISQVMLQNELAWRSEAEIRAGLVHIWEVMQACVARGCHTEGVLPGGLKVKRRAARLYRQLTNESELDKASLGTMDWVNLYALAVNEENAAGGRVVTAPTNGAAGIIPAVLHFYWKFAPGFNDDGVVRFLLAAGAIGILYKENASISGAEVGCQGEVGSACSMAAAALTEVLGGTPGQVENAAEIAMEHNLGLTCDPVGGLVQVPCIERNAMGAVKAINASRMAMRGDGTHFVSLDKVIKTMRDTGADMKTKYKETARGGLAVNVIEC
jgi:L-serine dehydratase